MKWYHPTNLQQNVLPKMPKPPLFSKVAPCSLVRARTWAVTWPGCHHGHVACFFVVSFREHTICCIILRMIYYIIYMEQTDHLTQDPYGTWYIYLYVYHKKSTIHVGEYTGSSHGFPMSIFHQPRKSTVTTWRAQIMSSFGFLLAPTTTSLVISSSCCTELWTFSEFRGRSWCRWWQMFGMFGLPQIVWFAQFWNGTCKTCCCNKETVNKVLGYYVYINISCCVVVVYVTYVAIKLCENNTVFISHSHATVHHAISEGTWCFFLHQTTALCWVPDSLIHRTQFQDTTFVEQKTLQSFIVVQLQVIC